MVHMCKFKLVATIYLNVLGDLVYVCGNQIATLLLSLHDILSLLSLRYVR